MSHFFTQNITAAKGLTKQQLTKCQVDKMTWRLIF
jgi:hypothetical protein